MKNNGYTFIEIIVVVGIFSIMIGLATISLLGSQRSANLTQVVDVLVSDVRSQQTKAMTGESVFGIVPAGYGIYLEADKYTLFSGVAYIPSDPANSTVLLSVPIRISSIGFTGSTLLFLPKSGEISGFVPGSNYVVIQESNSGRSRTITLNQYGVITSQ